MSDTIQAVASKKKVLVEAYVKVEPNLGRYYSYSSVEQRARDLEDWAKDFKLFVRDHRSQDVNDVEVIREFEEQCSQCHCKWEVGKWDDGKIHCEGCGAEVSAEPVK